MPDDWQVARYVQHPDASGKSATTASLAIAAIRFSAEQSGQPRQLTVRRSKTGQAGAAIAAQALCAAGDCARPLRLLTALLHHDDGRVELRTANSIHQLGFLADPNRSELEDFNRECEGLAGREFFREAEFPHRVLRKTLAEGG